MELTISGFPNQKLPFSKKGKEWRKRVVDWADKRSYFFDSVVRKAFINKKINYDLINGKLHLDDLKLILNPDNIKASYIPSNIQHYPIMNSKLNVLAGEEKERRYEFKVIITNPDAISELEIKKRKELSEALSSLLEEASQDESILDKELKSLSDSFRYDWSDIREIRANQLLNHYYKELKLDVKFNDGFMDAMIVGEELYQCDIVSGEPIVERLNPRKVHVFKNGYSNKIEDADLIILDDFWAPGKILDYYYDDLSDNDVKRLEEYSPFADSSEGLNLYDDTKLFVPRFSYYDDNNIDLDFAFQSGTTTPSSNYYDNLGNIRVLRIFWKSKRLVLKVKKYDLETGEPYYDYYPEDYKVNEALGEEAEKQWINEAWEGTKIGRDIYINIRPRKIQYNRMSNPSRCHFGIIGSVYNLNESRVYSLVDMMKPFQYMYDAVHDRLNKAIARNMGKIVKLDLALIPDDWEIDKWMHFAYVNGIAVVDSFKEGNVGAATGKLAGSLNNNSSGVIDAETGNYIQQHIALLEFIKQEMSKIVGITDQREGAVQASETVGGVQTSVRQSTYITERLFLIHDDVKKRVLEALLETAKIAMRGSSKKYNFILDDFSRELATIDGDEFAECDYGLVVDNSMNTLELTQKLDSLAQAALQNQALSFSSIIKIYNSKSLAQVQRTIEIDEADIQERQQQQQQAEQELAQSQLEQQAQTEQAKLDLEKYKIDQDNQTKIQVATISALGYSEDKDINDNSIPDVVEMNKLALEEVNAMETNSLKREELRIKEKEVETKAQTEKYKADKSLEVAIENKNKYDTKTKKT